VIRPAAENNGTGRDSRRGRRFLLRRFLRWGSQDKANEADAAAAAASPAPVDRGAGLVTGQSLLRQ